MLLCCQVHGSTGCVLLVQVDAAAREGSHVFGTYMEGARWDMSQSSIDDSRMKDLYPRMPVMTIRALPISKVRWSAWSGRGGLCVLIWEWQIAGEGNGECDMGMPLSVVCNLSHLRVVSVCRRWQSSDGGCRSHLIVISWHLPVVYERFGSQLRTWSGWKKAFLQWWSSDEQPMVH